MYSESEDVPLVFQEEFMTLTMEISKALPQFLVDTSNVDEEVKVVDIKFANEEEPKDVDDKEEPEWNDLETDTEDDDKIQYHFSGDDGSEDHDRLDEEDDDY